MTTETTAAGPWLGRYPSGEASPVGPWVRFALRSVRPNLGWVTFFLMLGVVTSVIWSLEAARWAPTPPLYLVLVVGFVAGAGLAKLHYHWIVLQSMALAVWAITFVLLFMRFLETPSGFEGIRVIGERFGAWIYAARTGGISTDDLPFAVVLVTVSWLLGYTTGWFTFRWGKVWTPLIIAGLGLLTNLSYLPGNFISYFYLYLFFAMLALAWASYMDRRKYWDSQRINHSPVIGFYGLNDAFWFGLLVVVIATILPVAARPPGFDKVYQAIRWPVERFSGDFNRLFAGVPARVPPEFRIFGSTLPFQGRLSLGDQIVFTVKSSTPTYWKVRSYPTYISQGWSSGPTEHVPVEWRQRNSAQAQYQSREAVLQEITLQFSPNQVPVGGIIGQSDLKLQAEVAVAPTYTISLGGSQFSSLEGLPPDLASLVLKLRNSSFLEPRGLRDDFRELLDAQELDSFLTELQVDERGVPVRITWTDRATFETYTLSLEDALSSDLLRLPPEVQPIARLLRQMSVAAPDVVPLPRRPVSDEAIAAMLPDDFELVSVERDEDDLVQSVSVRRVVPAPLDVLSLQSPERLHAEETYLVNSSISVATPEELRSAGEDYPGWVTDIYLQLPDTLPSRVQILARDLTRNAQTPYDKAVAIKEYLKTIPYSLNIPAPSFNSDGVDHFLFTARAGYSEYYGSAMAVMLRVVGVPARLAVGYGFGDEDADGVILVRDRNAHGWTEVFFPEYGWVDFEPTPGRLLPIEAVAIEGSDSPGGAGDDGSDLSEVEGDEELLPPVGVGPFSGGGFGFGFALPSWMAVLAAFGAALALLVGWQTYRWLLGVPDGVVGAYRKMVRLAHFGGIGPKEGQTAVEYGAALSSRFPSVQPAVAFVVGSYSRSLYSSHPLHDDDQNRVREAWRHVRFVLLRRVLRRLRLFGGKG